MSGVRGDGPRPRRGEVWWMEPDPVRGHEQGGRRPAVVVSVDRFNRSRIDLVVVCPLTRSHTPVSLHVSIDPPEGGLRDRSHVLVEHVRSISVERLGTRIGRLTPRTTALIEDRLGRILGIRAPRVGQLP